MKIVVADRNISHHRERFESRLPADATVGWHTEITSPELAADLTDADVFVGSTFTAAMSCAAPKLRLVHLAGAGTDGIDFDALRPHVQFANTFHHESSIAEYVVAVSILLWRRFLAQDRQLRENVWASPVYDGALPQMDTIGAAQVGFVGFGHIGQSAWNLLRTFGCTGAAITGRGLTGDGAGLRWIGARDGLDDLIHESDIIVVSAPLTVQTRSMIGATQLEALGPRGLLVNVGRGPLVDEKALYNALSNRDIAGAAVDVWYDYPGPNGVGTPSELPFADLDNLVMTPHSSGITRQTFLGRVNDITDNIGRLHRGEPLTNTIASDLASFMRTLPAVARPHLANNWHRFVGDPDDPEQLADMMARAPITKVDLIRTPLMVIQGANDVRVVQAESDNLVNALRARGVEVEYLIQADEGHGAVNPENMIEMWRSISRFLARHLGGRA